MSCNWIDATLGDYIDFKNGKSSPERNDGDPFSVFGSNGVIGYTRNTNAPENSLIVGRVGSYCGSVYHSYQKCWVTDNAIIGLPKNSGESEFWYFLLQKLDLNSFRSGSGQPLLNQATLNSIPIKIPDDSEVRSNIGKKLMLFSEKIHLNTQTNQTLESIAQTIFKSWFVDFEPVKAKMAVLAEGSTREQAELAAMSAISGKNEIELAQMQKENFEHYSQLSETAALFPSAMMESELGEIPEGWEVKNIENILELAYGKSLGKTERIDGNIPVYGSGGLTGWHNKYLVNGPGIIVGRKGTVGSIYWEKNNFFPIDTVFYVTPKNGIPLIYTYYLLQILGLENMNTDAAVPGLNRNNVYRLETIFSSIELINAFSKIANSLKNEFDLLLEQSNHLSKLRDSLLPKLLSGEINLE
jgi:type I restriction enzyme S subunit